MLKPKRYLLILFTTLALLIAAATAYVYNFTLKYPAPITSRISLDAKLKYVRENIDPNSIDTIIVGSSIGMNNVIGSILESSSKSVKHALNLSVYEATTLEVEQLLELAKAFPNVKRVIYSAQYSDFPHPIRYKNFDAKVLGKYMSNKLSYFGTLKLLFKACNNLPFCYERAKKWESKHQKPDEFTYLGFDHTCSVPLKIYRQEKVGSRWHIPHPGIMHGESFKAVDNIAKDTQKRGIKFYLAHQPYRPQLYKKHKKLRDAIEYFDKKIDTILNNYDNSYLIKLQNVPLSNRDFADRTHLNDIGSAKITKEIAKYIDTKER
jgi:hypothetical protein